MPLPNRPRSRVEQYLDYIIKNGIGLRLANDGLGGRVEAGDGSLLANNGHVFDAIGIPPFVCDSAEYPLYEATGTILDIADYASYGITKAGWYVFATVVSPDAALVTSATTVTGADGYIATVGETYVNLAIRFDVSAMSKTVTINWGEDNTETFVFRALDLAIYGLDYRSTFYVYNIEPFMTWEYAPVSTATFAGTTYYTESDDVFTKAAVVANTPVPENTYYIKSGDTYTLATDKTFVGTAYYEKHGDEYVEAAVIAGDPVPENTYYVHSRVIFEGMARNVTYKCDTIIDCPSRFVLPEIEDETHGCWFEIRLQHAGSYSSTLVPVASDVKVATEHTQAETKGFNTIDLHYMSLGGTKLWRFTNEHSTVPA